MPGKRKFINWGGGDWVDDKVVDGDDNDDDGDGDGDGDGDDNDDDDDDDDEVAALGLN